MSFFLIIQIIRVHYKQFRDLKRVYRRKGAPRTTQQVTVSKAPMHFLSEVFEHMKQVFSFSKFKRVLCSSQPLGPPCLFFWYSKVPHPAASVFAVPSLWNILLPIFTRPPPPHLAQTFRFQFKAGSLFTYQLYSLRNLHMCKITCKTSQNK